MRVLVACEFSGTVRNAFSALGHDAWSCDILPTERPGNHIQGDVLAVLGDGWDLMVAHPPCTYLSVSGARWCTGDSEKAAKRRTLREQALAFVQTLMNAPIPRIAIENPVSIISSRIKRPTQTIQPWQFGEPMEKRTCLWLTNLPPLVPTNIVQPEYVTSGTGRRWSKWFWETSMIPYPKRGHARSVTFQGIADAMADQWGGL